MNATLADSLAVVMPDLPDVLVPPEARSHMLDLARELAPVHRCGFEVRLGSSAEVDFQQGFVGQEDEARTLRSHLGRDRRWDRLEQLVSEWDDPASPLHRGLQDLWLEFDRPPASSVSVFVGFPRRPAPAGERLLLAERALDLLMGPGWSPWRETLAGCFGHCPDGAFVSHLGLMIGRPTPALRVNVKQLEPGDMGAYLSAIGWAGDREQVVELAQRLRPQVRGFATCLDVGSGIGERLGLECFMGPRPAEDPRWERLLDWLVEQGWCEAGKRDALLGWPGVIRPDAASGPWPADLVLATLRMPADHFTCLERQLSHVKVTYAPGREPDVKAYFGYIHEWRRPENVPEARANGNGARPRRGPALGDPISRATDLLLASRSRVGLWHDFSGTLGATEGWKEHLGFSDEWVSAFVATALAETDDPRALRACRRAWTALVRRRAPVAGWGYSRIAPIDADSTAWALHLAAAVGEADSALARRGQQTVAAHVQPDGGVSTYLDAARMRPVAPRMRPPDGSAAGWCSTSHACVTASAALLGHESALEFLRRVQRSDGSWLSYWWDDDAYATSLAAEALAATGRPDDRRRVAAAIDWSAARLGEDGVDGLPFPTALCVRALCLDDTADNDELRDRAVAWLLEMQEPDGGWPASALLLAPRPDATDRHAGPVPPMATLDENRIFTTATVLPALTRSRA